MVCESQAKKDPLPTVVGVCRLRRHLGPEAEGGLGDGLTMPQRSVVGLGWLERAKDTHHLPHVRHAPVPPPSRVQTGQVTDQVDATMSTGGERMLADAFQGFADSFARYC